MKINGYRVIANVKAWQEWEVEQDKYGVRLSVLDYSQESLDESDIVGWTFDGGEYSKDDYEFETLEELTEFLEDMEPLKESEETSE